MTREEIISIAALCITIIMFIAIKVTLLSFEITNLKDKINDLMLKLDHKLASPTKVKSEESDAESEE